MTEIEHKPSIIKIIAAFYPDAKIYLFGSYARRTDKQGSDIDVAIDVGKRLNLHERQFLWNLLDALPTVQKINLVDMHAVSSDVKESILQGNYSLQSLNRKQETFKNCYEMLERSMLICHSLKSTAIDDSSVRDLVDVVNAGIIKYFELAYETGWKFLKEYLAHNHDQEVFSPRAVFHACEEVHLFPRNMLNELITLADARNETAHIYSQVLAQEVCNSIEKHYLIFGKILEIIKI